ncbi:MAG TPA: DUF429 domain-containing protein [Chthoniobacterales bacterium]
MLESFGHRVDRRILCVADYGAPTTRKGIDISSQPKKTAACALTWEADRAVAAMPCLGCEDHKLTALIADSDAVGIDAPFGWPLDFTAAMAAWTFNARDNDLRKRLCFRETDRHMQATVGWWPLSVSADRIALPAMRTAALLLALISALTARAAMQGWTLRPKIHQAAAAQREGWIHLPTGFPTP